MIVFLGLLVAIRYLLFPSLDEYRDTIAAKLLQAVGQPVTIGAIRGAWNGWNPQVTIADVAIRNSTQADAPTVLLLPKVESA